MAHTRWVNRANLEKLLPSREAGDYMMGALQSVKASVRPEQDLKPRLQRLRLGPNVAKLS